MSVLTVSEALSFSLWLPCPKRFGGALLLPWLLWPIGHVTSRPLRLSTVQPDSPFVVSIGLFNAVLLFQKVKPNPPTALCHP